jgi:hypothetical protein
MLAALLSAAFAVIGIGLWCRARRRGLARDRVDAERVDERIARLKGG